MKHRLTILLLVMVAFCSCTKDLDSDAFLPSETETVNGMTVTWRDCMTKEQRQVLKDILNDMVRVEGGIFMMGTSQLYDKDAQDDESPAHWVKLSDYYICAHELGASQLKNLIDLSDAELYKGEIINYSRTDWENLMSMFSSFTRLNFSFPTEAQWEFAARGGNMSKGYLYPGSNDWGQIWHEAVDNTNASIPNELGLYNMADKQAEWCADRYATYPDGVIQTDPIASHGESYHGYVIRGGNYNSSGTAKNDAEYRISYIDKRICRSTSRKHSSSTTSKTWQYGCRPVINIIVQK